MGCQYSPQRSQSNEKSNFQNELTNQKFDSNSKLNLAYRHHHNVKPIIIFHFQNVLQNAKQFCSLKRSHHYGIFSTDILRWPVTSHWHRQDDCNCGVFAISEQTKQFLGLCHINEWRRGHRSHTLARFWTQFRVSLDLFTDLTTRESTVRTFLPRQLTVVSRIQNCTYRKIITYRTPQSNLPIEI